MIEQAFAEAVRRDPEQQLRWVVLTDGQEDLLPSALQIDACDRDADGDGHIDAACPDGTDCDDGDAGCWTGACCAPDCIDADAAADVEAVAARRQR